MHCTGNIFKQYLLTDAMIISFVLQHIRSCMNCMFKEITILEKLKVLKMVVHRE